MKIKHILSLTRLHRIRFRRPAALASALATVLLLSACGGGGGGGGGNNPPPNPPPPPPPPPPITGDDARRAVLTDIGEDILLPALRDFDTDAAALQAAAASLEAAPGDPTALDQARAAWHTAMESWQRNEVLQVGPAGRSTNPDMVAGGQDFREFIYSWPFTLDACALETAADNGDPVDGNTPINTTGLGALEYLLFTDTPLGGSCTAQPDAAERAAHIGRLADRVALLAAGLRERWEPADDNFLEQWNTAGLASSLVYARPQDALDALSIALFYVEKTSKDRKVALPTGLPATGLNCADPVACPEFLESRLSRRTGANIIANVQVFRDLFTGVNGGMGVNDLLEGINRQDLADQIVTELDAALAQLTDIENGQGFDAEVEAITDRNECVNAFSNSTGLPPCALLGLLKTAMDTFRGPIVAALGLAVPDSSAGDND